MIIINNNHIADVLIKTLQTISIPFYSSTGKTVSQDQVNALSDIAPHITSHIKH